MSALNFASLKRKQLVVELRFDPAFLIWDAAGRIGMALHARFPDVRNQVATPGAITFNAAGRYSIAVEIGRAFVSDFGDERNSERSTEDIASTLTTIVQLLEVSEFIRVGARFQYSKSFDSSYEAGAVLASLLRSPIPDRKFFGVEPKNVLPTYKVDVDDDEIGYSFSVYVESRNIDMTLPPEFRQFAEQLPKKQKQHAIVLDVDFSTKKSTASDALDLNRWLFGRERFLKRDSDELLSFVSRRHG